MQVQATHFAKSYNIKPHDDRLRNARLLYHTISVIPESIFLPLPDNVLQSGTQVSFDAGVEQAAPLSAITVDSTSAITRFLSIVILL